jgi:hypothetical protein
MRRPRGLAGLPLQAWSAQKGGCWWPEHAVRQLSIQQAEEA